nr:PREDICTED: proprotein convertase subtilisin/kexin type 5-like [Struthio camelus australis]
MKCIERPSNCDSCDKNKCGSCNKGFYHLGGICVSECGAGFFRDDISRECEACHRSCAMCVGYSYENCTGCKNNFQLSCGQCLNPRNVPPNGKFWSAKKQLQSCDPSCRTCDKDANVCTSCPEGDILTILGLARNAVDPVRHA